MTLRRIFCCLAAPLAASSLAYGQAAPPPVYTGAFGGGVAITSGNTDTNNFNLTLNVVRDPKTRNIMKASAAYLRGAQNDLLNVDRTSVALRDEYRLSSRAFFYGQTEYLRDKFKQIIFLWAPGGGLGYRFAASENTKFGVDGGLGGILEKNPGKATSKSGSVAAGQNFQQKISGTAVFTQSVSALWKMNDFGDSLTNLSIGLTTSIAKRLELKFEVLNSYKSKPPNVNVKKNDTAFVTAFVYKF